MADDKTEEDGAAVTDALDLPEQTSSPDTVAQLDDVTVKRPAAGTPPDSRVVEDPAHLGADDLMPANLGVAQVDDGLVRTNSATTPIADVLGTGAGAHHPPPSNVDKDGREQFGEDGPPTAHVDYAGPGAPASQVDEAADAPKVKTAAKSKAGADKTS